MQRLIAWSSTTDTGDRDELTPGVPDRSWSQVSVSARECIGVARCPFGTDCFAEKARDKAGHADVIVTNHALLAIDAMTDAAVLPEHELLVVDEAHELVDRVTGVATAELSATSLGHCAPPRRQAHRPRARTTARGRDGDLLVGDPRRDTGPHRCARRRDDHLPDRAARRREQGSLGDRHRAKRPEGGVDARRSGDGAERHQRHRDTHPVRVCPCHPRSHGRGAG